jgi:superfamily I DNA/RNA helicase
MCDCIITNEEIEKAEKDILEIDKHFNEKQKLFIRCLDSCCMQAYAGTGKTSAIVGKLHVLSQKEVWKNGRGICVISHTNVAVDEIKKHVAKHYSDIMQYPNFVGTIQEFINKFLFIPYLASKELQIKFQDEKFDFSHNWALLNQLEDKNKKAINQAVVIFKDKGIFSKICLIDNEPCFDGKSFPLQSVNRKRKSINKIPETSLLEINRYFSTLIKERRLSGRFLFDESFIDGGEYLKQNPILKDIIRQRFQFVFLDEAQDCSEIQLKILYELFDGSPKAVFQQVGDINQAISETKWTPGENSLFLEQSTRFGDNIAEFINMFQVGAGTGVSGTTEETKKYLFIYNSGKEKDVLQKYAEILKTEKVSADKGYFAISHTHAYLLKFPGYSEKIAKNKSKKISYRFDSDIEYVSLLTRDALLKQGTHIVSETLVSLLYKHYKTEGTWRELRELLRSGKRADDFRKLVIEISNDILTNSRISHLENVKNRLNAILGDDQIIFGNGDATGYPGSAQNKIITNTFNFDGINVNIGTVHSVKGQTHSATLLFSNKEYGRQDIQYIIDGTKMRAPEFKRLFYVASSRAKYLFAFAIEKTAYEELTDQSYFNGFKPPIII